MRFPVSNLVSELCMYNLLKIRSPTEEPERTGNGEGPQSDEKPMGGPGETTPKEPLPQGPKVVPETVLFHLGVVSTGGLRARKCGRDSTTESQVGGRTDPGGSTRHNHPCPAGHRVELVPRATELTWVTRTRTSISVDSN